MHIVYRKSVAIALAFSILLVSSPAPTQAGFGFSFDIFSVGPFSFGIDLPLKGLLPLAGAFLVGSLLFSFFSDDSPPGGSYRYAASYSGEGASPVPSTFSSQVTVKPEDHMRGEPIRIKYHSIIRNNKINLVGGGSLVVQDDGKLTFTGTAFQGYAYIHYDRSLSIWDDQGNPVLVLIPRAGQTLILQERSARSREVLGLLFGAATE